VAPFCAFNRQNLTYFNFDHLRGLVRIGIFLEVTRPKQIFDGTTVYGLVSFGNRRRHHRRFSRLVRHNANIVTRCSIRQHRLSRDKAILLPSMVANAVRGRSVGTNPIPSTNRRVHLEQLSISVPDPLAFTFTTTTITTPTTVSRVSLVVSNRFL
jgi:hypothetical protein